MMNHTYENIVWADPEVNMSQSDESSLVFGQKILQNQRKANRDKEKNNTRCKFFLGGLNCIKNHGYVRTFLSVNAHAADLQT